MKKRFVLLVGSAILMASCGNKNNSQARIQALIDSTVNAKLAKHDAENAAKNDSTLKAMEKEKAELITREQLEEKRNGQQKNASVASQKQPPVSTVSPHP